MQTIETLIGYLGAGLSVCVTMWLITQLLRPAPRCECEECQAYRAEAARENSPAGTRED